MVALQVIGGEQLIEGGLLEALAQLGH